MSATFRIATKKKTSQDELRKLMAQHKNSKDVTKINNPLAKYNDVGQLMCVLCKTIVRSENVWQVHVNAKQHRDNIAEAKKLKELTNNFTSSKVKSLKRPGTPTYAPQEKKLKSILKNAPSIPDVTSKTKNDVLTVVSHHNEEIKRAPIMKNIKEVLPGQPSTSVAVQENNIEENEAPTEPIPEGFFDDPILDAKARHIEYKDPIEEEWDKFQKEIKEETSASAVIIAGEQEEATAERQIDEIDEQMRNWSRVLDLEVKKEETKKNTHCEHMETEESNDSDDEIDLDEFFDWRAKKSYR